MYDKNINIKKVIFLSKLKISDNSFKTDDYSKKININAENQSKGLYFSKYNKINLVLK